MKQTYTTPSSSANFLDPAPRRGQCRKRSSSHPFYYITFFCVDLLSSERAALGESGFTTSRLAKDSGARTACDDSLGV